SMLSFTLFPYTTLFRSNEVVTQSLEWIKIVGNGYVSLLQMLIMPLVFVSIVSAFTRMKESSKIRKISFTVLATLLGTTAIAALIDRKSTRLNSSHVSIS